MRAWDPESRILAIDRGRARESTGMSCQPIAGYEREMFSAGCTMNIGSKKLLHEVASTFCGAQVKTSLGRTIALLGLGLILPFLLLFVRQQLLLFRMFLLHLLRLPLMLLLN